MNRVRNVVRKIHDLSFEAALTRGDSLAHPVESRTVVLVDGEFALGFNGVWAFAPRPRVFADRIQGGTRQVQTCRPVFAKNFGFQTCDDSQGLGVSFKTTDLTCQLVERKFAVVSKGRVA